MEEMVYGLLLDESPFTTMSEKEQFRKVSVDWHCLLGFQSAWEHRDSIDPGIERQRAAAQEAAELRRYREMHRIDPEVQLARFYGRSDVEFRGIQRPAPE